MSHLFSSGGQIIEASASVFPVNIQGWLPLGSTRLISLQFKGLSSREETNCILGQEAKEG